jgi:hypothetical protein
VVGNGQCLNTAECCSSFGWCGTSDEHCVDWVTVGTPSDPDGDPDAPTCGSGNLGNGSCLNTGECCSVRHFWRALRSAKKLACRVGFRGLKCNYTLFEDQNETEKQVLGGHVKELLDAMLITSTAGITNKT